VKYTCSEDVNPPLQINGISEETKHWRWIMEDPDAPGRNFLLPLDFYLEYSAKGCYNEKNVPGIEGKKQFGNIGNGGLCPLRDRIVIFSVNMH